MESLSSRLQILKVQMIFLPEPQAISPWSQKETQFRIKKIRPPNYCDALNNLYIWQLSLIGKELISK